MNCKPGDLAYIVGPLPQNIGKPVTCVAIDINASNLFGEPMWRITSNVPLIDTQLNRMNAGWIGDQFLRPIAGPERTDVIETEILNPLELALGITAKAWL